MKKILSTLLLFLVVTSVSAMYYEKYPIDVILPDSNVLHCFVTGDEYYHRLHDSADYTIVQSAEDGYYYYAVKEGEELVPSDYKAGSVDPATVGLVPGLRISPTVYKEKIAEMQSVPGLQKIKAESSGLSEGTLANIVIYVRFKGESEFTTSRATFDSRLNGTNVTSLKDYFDEVSYSKLNVSSEQFPTLSISHEDIYARGYYQPYSSTNTIGYTNDNGSREQAMVKRAIDAVSSQIPGGLTVDNNNDGYVDNVTIVVRGNADGWGNLLWPHMWSLYMEDAYINSKRVGNYIFIMENMFDVLTMCHEMFHVIGAPDLYNYTWSGITPVGPWDIMDGGGGHTHMLAYMKWKYASWISSIPEITKSGDYTILPLTSPTKNCYKLKSPYSSTEFFVLEYRKKTAGTYEMNIPQQGMTITRINTMAGNGNAGGPPNEVFTYRSEGSIYSNGDLYDAVFGQLVSRPAFNSTTDPRPFLVDGSDAGIDISNIKFTIDSMTFHVEVAEQLAKKTMWSVKADNYTQNPVNVRDDKTSTIWQSSSTSFPHWIEVNFNSEKNIKGFKYTPRQSSQDGRIKDYEFYTSFDAIEWIKVTEGTFPNSAETQTVTFPESRCKYARLVALNEVSGKTYASVAEINFIFNNIALLPKTAWTLLEASSYKSTNLPQDAYDGLGNTFWHTALTATYPHELAINMNGIYCLESMAYLPRQDGSKEGTIAGYEFYTSLDGTNWKLVSEGTWAKNMGEKMITFPKTVCQYIKLVALSEIYLKNYASASEISVFGSYSNDTVSPITLPLNFRIASRDSSTIKLAWDNDSIDNSVLYYNVSVSDSVVSDSLLGMLYTNVLERSIDIDTTQNYTFSLQAFDGSGNVSQIAQIDFEGIIIPDPEDPEDPEDNDTIPIYNPDAKTIIYVKGDVLHISNTNGNMIRIYNMMGQLLTTKDCNSVNVEIDINNYPLLVIVAIIKEDQMIVKQKLILKELP